MQCNSLPPISARPSGAPPPMRLAVHTTSLLAAFATVPDTRSRQGRRYSLAAILALAVAAILSNHLSVLAIAEWGNRQPADLLRALGFRRATPHQSTIQRAFAKLDPHSLSVALERYFAPLEAAEHGRGSQGVAIDGKAQRGRLAFDSKDGPVHALTAFLHEQGVVLAQEPIETKGQIEKAEAELTVAPQLIKRVGWRGRVMTGDAQFCQRNLCQQVIDAKGDYLLIVKENQPTLLDDIRMLFDPPIPCLPLDDRREAQTVDNGHGRHRDTRRLMASTDLVGYSDWPGLAQVFRYQRHWEEHSETKDEVQYGITSLPPDIGDACRLLALKRGHWQIENGLHYSKDVTLGEDRSLIHSGYGPSVMAMLRDATISLLHQAGWRTIASRLRYHSCRPEEALRLLVA